MAEDSMDFVVGGLKSELRDIRVWLSTISNKMDLLPCSEQAVLDQRVRALEERKASRLAWLWGLLSAVVGGTVVGLVIVLAEKVAQ